MNYRKLRKKEREKKKYLWDINTKILLIHKKKKKKKNIYIYI